MTTQSSSFMPIRPPLDVQPYRVDTAPQPQRVDYDKHPAYAGFAQAPMPMRVRATARFLASLVPLAAKRIVSYELIPNEVRMRKRGLFGRLRLARAGLANAVRRPRRASRIRSDLARVLAQQGCAVVAAPSGLLSPVEQASAPAFAKLSEARRRSAGGKRDFLDSRYHADAQEEAKLFETVGVFLEEAGVIAATSEYIGRPARLIDVNPQINDRSDGFWREIFPDHGPKPLPRAAYFHRDASGGDLKAIIYMSEVGPDNGPFGYVIGSHRLPIGNVDNFICEANDHNGFAATDIETRREFMALPARFRQKGSFGNDLSDEETATGEIVRAAWSIVGPKGAVVLFDTKGVHRGGMVESGERRVITCVIG